MNKKIIIGIIVILVVIIGGFVLLQKEKRPEQPGVQTPVLENPRDIAENWIINNSPTYLFDGFNLTLVSGEEMAEERLHSFVFSFESTSAGYGDRQDEMVAQVITPHTIEVIVENGEVVSAVTDGVYDELNQTMIEEALPETMTIEVYFVEVREGQEQIVAVGRSIPYTLATARAAVEELLKGVLPHEAAEGLSTSINEGTELQSIEIENSTVLVDFNEKLEENVAGSARVMAIREQIEKTLLQFDTIAEVIISINGQTEDILQP